MGDRALELGGGASYTKFEPILSVNDRDPSQAWPPCGLALLLEQAARDVATLRVMLLALSRSRTPQVSTNQTSICLTEGVPGIEMRVFLRDKNPDLMDQYLNQGIYRSIPVFAFFDDAWNEVGVFIERPDSVTGRRAQRRKEIFAKHPEFGSPDTPVDQLPEDVRARLQQELQKMRDEMADWANAEVVRELRAIVEGRTTRGGARQPDRPTQPAA